MDTQANNFFWKIPEILSNLVGFLDVPSIIELSHVVKNNEVMKIFKKMPNQAYLLVRDPEHTWFFRSQGLNPLRNFLRTMGM